MRRCQFKDLDEKKRYDLQSSNGHLHEKPLEIMAERGKNACTNLGTRFPRASYFSRKRIRCARNMGAHVRHDIRSTKGMKTG